MTSTYRREIAEAAAAHAFDPRVVEAVVAVESSGRTHAYRFEPQFFDKYLAGKPEWRGAVPERVSASYGLMQVMFVVAKELGFSGDPELLFVPRVGLDWGCRKLATLMAWAEGDPVRALCAYNGGRGGNTTPPYRNQAYADRVLLALAHVPDPSKGQQL
jgi:soluble lytic murein transglycosylase-like protein